MPHFVWQRRLVLCSARWIFFQFAPRVRENEADRLDWLPENLVPALHFYNGLGYSFVLCRGRWLLLGMDTDMIFFEVCREILRPSERSMFCSSSETCLPGDCPFCEDETTVTCGECGKCPTVCGSYIQCDLSDQITEIPSEECLLAWKSIAALACPSIWNRHEIIARVESFKPIVLSKHLETGPIGWWNVACESCAVDHVGFSGQLFLDRFSSTREYFALVIADDFR